MISAGPSLFKSLQVATSGMQAQSDRMLKISENLANAESVNPNGEPYQRKGVVFESKVDSKSGLPLVKVKNTVDTKTPFARVYAPEDPRADANGYVQRSNIKPMIEITDLMHAARSHEANLRAYQESLKMIRSTIELLSHG